MAPELGAVSVERMSALYGLDLGAPNLQILMRPRACNLAAHGRRLMRRGSRRPRVPAARVSYTHSSHGRITRGRSVAEIHWADSEPSDATPSGSQS